MMISVSWLASLSLFPADPLFGSCSHSGEPAGFIGGHTTIINNLFVICGVVCVFEALSLSSATVNARGD